MTKTHRTHTASSMQVIAYLDTGSAFVNFQILSIPDVIAATLSALLECKLIENNRLEIRRLCSASVC